MTRTVWIEWGFHGFRRPILDSESNGAHESSDPGKQEFGIADGRFDLEGGQSQITQVRGVPQIAQDEHASQSDEEEPCDPESMVREMFEDRDARCGRQTREPMSPTRLVAGHHQTQILDQDEERTDLPALGTWQCSEMAIDVVRKTRIDPCNGQPRSGRKEHVGGRIDERGLATEKHGETRRRRRVTRDEPPIEQDGERNNEECREHRLKNTRGE